MEFILEKTPGRLKRNLVDSPQANPVSYLRDTAYLLTGGVALYYFLARYWSAHSATYSTFGACSVAVLAAAIYFRTAKNPQVKLVSGAIGLFGIGLILYFRAISIGLIETLPFALLGAVLLFIYLTHAGYALVVNWRMPTPVE